MAPMRARSSLAVGMMLETTSNLVSQCPFPQPCSLGVLLIIVRLIPTLPCSALLWTRSYGLVTISSRLMLLPTDSMVSYVTHVLTMLRGDRPSACKWPARLTKITPPALIRILHVTLPPRCLLHLWPSTPLIPRMLIPS